MAAMLPKLFSFTFKKREDYVKIHSVLNDWWGGRDMAAMLPKLFSFTFKKRVLSLKKMAKR